MTPTADIVAAYAAGQHLRQVGQRFGLSHEAVRKRLLKAGVSLRPRSRKGSGRPLGPAKTALMAEVAGDLWHFPAGANIDDLTDWLGSTRRDLREAVAALFASGTIRIIPAGGDE